MKCLFTSDLHGNRKKYGKLFEIIKEESPDYVFIGGDILPSSNNRKEDPRAFLRDFLSERLREIDRSVDKRIKTFVIMGNDDPRVYEKDLKKMDDEGLIHYIHDRTEMINGLYVTGYSFVPPTPFRLKDWERYDVSRYVGVGAVSPEKGTRTVDISDYKMKHTTIKDDLERLSKNSPPEKTIYLFHTPPYDTDLDRADLDGKKVDHAPVDVHVGSIAVKRFIEEKEPYLTLHGHVHETVVITGNWKEKIGRTFSFTGAHSGNKIALVRFDTEELEEATRTVIDTEP